MVICKRGAGRPSRAESAAIENRILDCARRAFVRTGFSGTSMDEIAEECRLTKHTIYRRYPGKSALLNAVIARELAWLTGPLPERADGDPILALKAAAKRMYDYTIIPENVAFFSFVESEAIYSDEVRASFHRMTGEGIAPIADAAAAAQAAGLLPSGPPMVLAETLLDLIDGPCRRMQLGRADVFHGETPQGFFERRWGHFLAIVGG